MSEESQALDWGEQTAEGEDLRWLRYNLTLMPEERLMRHQRALQFILELKRAAELAGLPQCRQSPE